MISATSDRLASTADVLEQLLREFLLERSVLEPAPQVRVPGVIAIFPTHEWAQLDGAGRAVQAKLLREHARFSNLVAALLQRAPEPARSAAADGEETVREVIERSEDTDATSAEDVLTEAVSGVRAQLEQVKSLYDPAPGQPVFVPDANAIIWNRYSHLFDGAYSDVNDELEHAWDSAQRPELGAQAPSWRGEQGRASNSSVSTYGARSRT